MTQSPSPSSQPRELEGGEGAATVARVGDRLCVQVRYPNPRTITMVLATPESAAYANDLLSDPASGWKPADPAGVMACASAKPTDAEVDAALIAHHLNVTPLSRQDMRRALTGFLKGRAHGMPEVGRG